MRHYLSLPNDDTMMNPLIIGDLKVPLPIVQGGMGVGISLSGLASAVAREGGIGVISAACIGMSMEGYERNLRQANREGLRNELRKARSLTKGVLGVNLMVALTDYDDLLKISIEEEADVVFLSAGMPLKLPEFVLDTGFRNIKTKFIPKVSSAKAARIIFQYWQLRFGHIPDAVAVEGPLAGGHLGFSRQELNDKSKTLEQITKEIVEVVKSFETTHHRKIPVIAGGGIYTGADIYRIMRMGVQAVKMGTRFVTTYECDASEAFKMSYINSREEDITIIDSPVGLPGRVIRNDFVDQINKGETKPFTCPWKCLKPCDYEQAPYCIALALLNSARGKMDESFAFAGANAYRATKLQSVKEVFSELLAGYAQEHELQEGLIKARNGPPPVQLPVSLSCSGNAL